jgi:hypothetical protein
MPNDNEPFLDPVDLAMFAGPRASVPLMSLLYSKEANAGTDYERFAQQRAYEMAMAERQRNAQIQRAIEMRRQQELDARIPPEVQRFYINSRYDPTTATRRVDYETPPMRNFGSPGSEMRAAPRRFQKGGSARKTLQQMMDELLVRGAKTAAKDTPDIGRRALFGLRPQQDLPLAKLHPDIEKATESRITKALKGAPQVTEESVEVNPAKGSIKSTLQSVAGTPMSRRAVLSAAAGQAARHMIPGLDSLAPKADDLIPGLDDIISGMGDVVPEAVARAAPISFLTPQAMIAASIPKIPTDWKKRDKAVEELSGQLKEQFPDYFQGSGAKSLIQTMQAPRAYMSGDVPSLKTPSQAMHEILQFDPNRWDDHVHPLAYKAQLRELRDANPDVYNQIIEGARIASNNSVDKARELGLNEKKIQKYLSGDIDSEGLPKYYMNKIDRINSGFGGDY